MNACRVRQARRRNEGLALEVNKEGRNKGKMDGAEGTEKERGNGRMQQLRGEI